MDFTGESWPFDGPLDVDGNAPALPEGGWEDLFDPLHEPGSIAVPGDLDGQVYADGSGMLVKSRPAPLGAMVKGHRWRNPLPDSWPVDVGDAQPRIDRVFLRLDPAGNQLGLKYVKGIPDTNPTPPEPTRVQGGIWDTRWASVRVEANAGTDGNAIQAITALKVTDERRFRGQRIWQYPTFASLPPAGFGTPYNQLAIVADTGHTYRWNSATWELYVLRDTNAPKLQRSYVYANEASFPPVTEIPFGQLGYSLATGHTYRAVPAGWEIYIRRTVTDDVPDPQPFIMGVSTAWSWPPTQQAGYWYRRNGFVTARATTALNYNPPYANVLFVGLPNGPMPAGVFCGRAVLTNYQGQVKHDCPLFTTGTGVEAGMMGFGGYVNVTPANGDIVTADFLYRFPS